MSTLLELHNQILENFKNAKPYNPEEEKKNALEVTIKPSILDTSVLNEDNSFNEFRPENFEQYIGQNEAKEKIKTFLIGSQKYNDVFPHLFISGFSGMGKSLLSTITAHQLNKKIVYTTGGELKNEQVLVDKIAESEGGIIFVDEANMINKKVGFFMLPLMEQFKIQGKKIKPFVMIFATTHKGDISKDLDALIQRCEEISLRPYTESELANIVQQYLYKQYPNEEVEDDVIYKIVKNSRAIPRNAKNMLKSYIYCQSWEKVKQFNHIVTDGLTEDDIKLLKYLKSNDGASKSTCASYLRMKPQTYEWDVESYLLHRELIEIKNKRKISENGKLLLEKLNNVK